MNAIINASGKVWLTDAEVDTGIPNDREGHIGERHLYKYMRDNLPPEWTVIYDRTFDAGNQSAQIDFLVMVPGKGVVNVDAKGPGYRCVNGVVSLGGKGDKDVFKEAERGIHVFDRYVRNSVTNGADWGAFNKVVVFIETDFGSPLPGGTPYLQGSDLANPKALESKILECLEAFNWCFRSFAFWGDRIKDFLCASVNTVPVPTDFLGMEQFSRVGLDQEQQEISYLIEESRYVHVTGGAGTGKTLIAMATANELVKKGKRVLYVCFNTALAEWLRAEQKASRQTSQESLVITNFHKLGPRIGLRDYTVSNAGGFDRAATDAAMYSSMGRDYRKKGLAKFDVALIDEAQDLTNDNLFVILSLLKAERRVALFSDDRQILFAREWCLDELMFESQVITKELKRNYRNTDKIFKSFREYSGETTVPMIRTTDGYITKDVVHLDYGQVCQTIEVLLRQGRRPSEIALIATAKKYLEPFNKVSGVNGVPVYIKDSIDKWMRKETILKTQVTSFKGLESSIVFLFSPPSDSVELKYVGESRAKYELHIVEGLPQ